MAQSELQACETQLANKERELEVLRLSTVRVGLHARCTAMVNCGWSWGEMGKEGLSALESLDDATSGHCELQSLNNFALPHPLPQFPRRIPLGSLSALNLYLSQAMHPQISLQSSLLNPLRRLLSHFHRGNRTSSLQIPATLFLDLPNRIHLRSYQHTLFLSTRFRQAQNLRLLLRLGATPAARTTGPWKWSRTVGLSSCRSRRNGKPSRNDDPI